MKEYFLFINDQVSGPFSLPQLLDYHTTSSTLIWTKESNAWLEARQYPEVIKFIETQNNPKAVFENVDLLKVRYFQLNTSAAKIRQKFYHFQISFWISVGVLAFLGIGFGSTFYLYQENEFFISMIPIITYSSFILLSFPATFAFIYFLEFIYYGWKIIEDNPESVPATKAVGYLFIPFYNFYWILVSFKTLTVGSNQLLKRISPNNSLMSESIPVAFGVFFILTCVPFLGLITLIPLLATTCLFAKQLSKTISTELAYIEQVIHNA